METLIMDDNKSLLCWKGWLGALLDKLPCTCRICHRSSSSLLCAECRESLQRPDNSCIQCGESLPDALPLAREKEIQRCGRCITRPPAYQQTLFAYAYSGAMAQLIQQFKYSEALILSRLLAELIIENLHPAFTDSRRPDILIPIPLHPGRLRQRGFNQSLELARQIGKILDIPVYKRLIVRTRATPTQTGLNRRTREKNIRGAFVINQRQAQNIFAGKYLAIVDDVVTTGSTTRELANVLSQLDPEKISVIAAAKTQP